MIWVLLLPQLALDSMCADALERQLSAWHATAEVLETSGGPLGGPVYRIATDKLGVWITLHRPRGLDTTSLFLTNATETVRFDFGPTCEPAPVSAASAPTVPADAFTDAELDALLARNGRLVVYLWSPHLPLSVEGYSEIAAAAASVGVPLTVLVDASAERGLVERVANEHGIPPEARRPMGSVELLFRDLAVHTPSTIVFAHGAVSAPLPGYRNRAAYTAYLQTIFRAEPVGEK